MSILGTSFGVTSMWGRVAGLDAVVYGFVGGVADDMVEDYHFGSAGAGGQASKRLTFAEIVR